MDFISSFALQWILSTRVCFTLSCIFHRYMGVLRQTTDSTGPGRTVGVQTAHGILIKKACMATSHHKNQTATAAHLGNVLKTVHNKTLQPLFSVAKHFRNGLRKLKRRTATQLTAAFFTETAQPTRSWTARLKNSCNPCRFARYLCH